MSRWLVTGGCGFIGSHLAEALIGRGDTVIVLDDLSTGRRENAPEGAEIVIGDISDADLVKTLMADVDGCFHLAAIASVQKGNEEWVATHRTNLSGSITIFDAARATADRAAVPVVYASSAAVFGDNPDLPLDEESATRPLSAYGADKLGCELHGRVATLVHGVPTTGLRFFNVYGPRQDPKSPYSGVIAIFSDRIKAGKAVRIFGDGEQTRDFIYVGDVVAHLLAAMDSPADTPRIFNVCTGRQTSIRQLAEAIGEVEGRQAEIVIAPAREGDIRHSFGRPDKAIRELNVRAQTTLIDGLRQTLAALPEG